MTPDDLLPDPAYRITASVLIDASPEIVWRELVTLPMSALPLGFALTLLRHAPDVVLRRERRVVGTDTFFVATPIPVLLSDAPRRVISAGPSQAWKLVGAQPAPAVALGEFRDWQAPGWIKVVMGFDLTAGAAGQTLLVTETRVSATDSRTGRRFAPYWWAIRAGSALIRREVLAATKRRAESR